MAQSSPIEHFRDRVAYREEVRAASLETQLDDRHDIAGNTLYRVKFGVTIVPEHDTSAWALVYVELKAPDDIKSDWGETYRDWLKYYEDQLNDELDRLSNRSTEEWQPEEFRTFSGYVTTTFQEWVQEQECKDAAGADVCKDELTKLKVKKQAELENRKRDAFAPPNCRGKWALDRSKWPPECAELQAQCDASFKPPDGCKWPVSNQERLDALLQAYREFHYRKTSPGESWPRPQQFLRRVIAKYLVDRLEKHDRHELWRALEVDCETGICRMTLNKADNGAVKNFMDALTPDQVFAYAVSPKESVQRIENLASSQHERQLALRASFKGPQVPLDLVQTLLQQSEKDDSLLQAVLRKPLVVGFAPQGKASPPSDPQHLTVANSTVANFGWIIGPRFDIGDGGTARFRHAPSENDVSAIISVPSWWKSAVVKVTTCWLDDRQVRKLRLEKLGEESEGKHPGCKDEHRQDPYFIGLPGTSTEIGRKLRLTVVRRPSLSAEIKTSVVAGERADILIEGNHLWRSTVVTLDGRPATNITVLPDMKGIVARFDEVAMPPEETEDLEYELKVFTSEGVVSAKVGLVVRPTPAAVRTPAASLATNKHTKEVKQ